MTAAVVTTDPGPPSGPSITRWLRQIQPVATRRVRMGEHLSQTREQTPAELRSTQIELLESLSGYLRSMLADRPTTDAARGRAAKKKGGPRPVPRAVRDTMTHEFCRRWGCTEHWLAACLTLYQHIGPPPTRHELTAHWNELEEIVLAAQLAELEAEEAAAGPPAAPRAPDAEEATSE